MDSLRHRPRRLPPEAHDAPGTRARLRLDLPAPVLACLDLAPPSGAVARGSALSCDVLPLQAFEPVLAFADQARCRQPRVEAARRDDALAARALSQKSSPKRAGHWRSRANRLGGSLASPKNSLVFLCDKIKDYENVEY